MTSVENNYFSYDYTFSSENGMQFAFGISAYDGDPEPIDDPSYGRLTAGYVVWKDGKYLPSVSVPIRNCTEEDLDIVDVKETVQKFYPTIRSS